MTLQEPKDKVFVELEKWKRLYDVKELDTLIATPPCQGMSIAGLMDPYDERNIINDLIK